MSHQKAFDTSLDCDCFGCTRSVMCGFNGAERCDVCVFDMKNWKHPRRCLISVCTKMSVKEKNDCIMEYNRLLSEHMQVSVLSEGDDVFCSWHINGRRYWGKVQRRYQSGDCKSDMYDVQFHDSRMRKTMERSEVFDVWEYNVWKEKIRVLHGDLVYLAIEESSHMQRSVLTLKCDEKFPDPINCPIDGSSFTLTESMDKRRTRGSHFSLSELFRFRCHSCATCTLADCAKCESCLFNLNSTSRERQVCWLKLCKKVSKENKIRLPAVDGWSFFFSDSTSTKYPSSISHLPSIYHKLRLLHSSSMDSTSVNIFDAIHSCSSDGERRKLGNFFEQSFGCPLHETINHVLIGMGYYYTCFSAKGTVKEFSGKISRCSKHIITGELLFTIQYTLILESGVKSIECDLSEENVSESMAWGGYQSYSLWAREDVSINERSMAKTPFYIQWRVPSSRKVERVAQHHFPSLILEYKGHKLQFYVKPSKIQGAGNGFFLSCTEGEEEELVMEPGEMLDLGVYAPLRDIDIKSKHISLVKNLLFEWQIETWAFAAHNNRQGAFVYDPTEDCSGLPNCSTQMNGICFVNEIDGKSETASVTAQYDPQGNIHYLLGHWEEHEGPLKIKSDGKAQELLIDYGESYERCRLRNGYSRLGLTSVHHRLHAKLEDDETAVSDISSFTANQVCDCLSFFETRYTRGWLKASVSNHQRALLAVLSLNSRLDVIVQELNGFNMCTHEFCDGGFSNLHVGGVKTRFKTVIAKICSHFRGRELKEMILSMKLLRNAVSEKLGYVAKESTLNSKTLVFELVQ